MQLNRPSPLAIHLAMLINMLSIGSLMMVMPLGPDFVRELGMRASDVGYLAGGATLAAAFSAAVAAPWLDRLPRTSALVVLLCLRFALLGSCALADNALQLILLFILSGLATGPLGALLIAAVLDMVEPAQRGRKLAYVSMGYSLAAILAVPLALEVAIRAGWQAPFLLFAGLGLLCALLCRLSFPASRPRPGVRGNLLDLLRSPLCLVCMLVVGLQTAGHFLLVPHLSQFFQFNLRFARDEMGLLYLCGGLASLALLHLGGRWMDRGHAATVALLASGGLALITLLGFAIPLGLPVYLVFTLFMGLAAVRTSSTLTIASGVPRLEQRAGFMALLGTVGNIAAGGASLASARYLQSAPDDSLIGFDVLAWIYVLFGLLAAAGVLCLLYGRRAAPGQENRQQPPAATRVEPLTHTP